MHIHKFLISAAVVITFVVNMASVLLPLNGVTTQQLSAANPTLITPANYVFGIWSVIYLGLFAFAIMALLGRVKNLQRLTIPFVLASIFNSAWIFAWHYRQIELSMILMISLLLSLVLTYLSLGEQARKLLSVEYWAVRAPLVVYLAWISLATIVNAAVTLNYLGWDGLGLAAEVWSALMLVITAILALLLLLRRQEFLFGVVVIWASIGIYAQSYTELVNLVSLAVAGVIGLTIVLYGLTKTR